MSLVRAGLMAMAAASIALGASAAVLAANVEDITIENDGRAVPTTVVVPDGEGPFPVVVMNHGHGGGRQENGGFGKVADALAKEGILTIRMDFPGSGDSTEPFTEGYLSNMISDSNASLDYVLENYPADPDRLGIFGYSMGGRIALTIAGSVDNPYRAVALLAPSGNPGEELMVPFLGGQAEYDRLYAEASGDKGYAEFLTQWGQTQQLSKTWFDELLVSKPLDAIGNFKGDMLIVYGDKDVVVPAEVNQSVVAAYPAAKVVVVPEADHGYGFYSDQPDVSALVESSIVEFFVDSLK